MAVKTRRIAGLSGAAFGGGTETIETFGHDLSMLGGPSDVGGPMILSRAITTPYMVPYKYGGKIYPFQYYNWPNSLLYAPRSETQMRSDGTTAIARTTPTSPIFSASTALGELRQDGVPSVIGVQTWRERTLKARSAGSEYLNYQFGWVPLVNDVRNFAHTVRNHHQILQDFQAGSGKVTRVGYNFPSSSAILQGSGSIGIRYQDGWGWTTTVPGRWTEQLETRSWFKGAFTYHIPVGKSAAAKAAQFASYANHLYGVRLTPEVLWNLAPWTWALDWFSNAGDIIHNVSTIGQDGLVLKYGYIMSHSRKAVTITSSERYLGGFDKDTIYGSSATWLQEHKKRFPANPYSGFSVNPGPLSATQSAILVALGLSRSHL